MTLLRFFRLYRSCPAWTMLGMLLAQQLVVASSTLWLTRLAEAIRVSRNFMLPLSLYLASLLLPYIPGALGLLALKRWELGAQSAFIARMLAQLEARVSVWNNASLRERHMAVLSKDGPAVISVATRYAYDVVTSGLNTVLNILAVSLLIDQRLLVSYAVSVLLALGLMRLQAGTGTKLARAAEDSRIGWSSTLMLAWDNVVLGNSYHLELWSARNRTNFARYEKRIFRSAAYLEGVGVLVSLVTFLPTLATAAWLFSLHSTQTGFAFALAITLPRLFMILNSSNAFLYFIAEGSALQGRLDRIDPGLIASTPGALEQRIAPAKISVETAGRVKGIATLADVLSLVAQPGRITVSGQNGSGKSSLLLWLKESLGERCTYLPAQHGLEFSAERLPGSMGQVARQNIQELFSADRSPVLLLDEWDANLDESNRQQLSQLIEQMSATRTVVEVRHRSGT